MPATLPRPGRGPGVSGAPAALSVQVDSADRLAKLESALVKAERASRRASEARRALPAGSSRARVTSANARWMRAAEYRDLLLAQLRDLRAAE